MLKGLTKYILQARDMALISELAQRPVAHQIESRRLPIWDSAVLL